MTATRTLIIGTAGGGAVSGGGTDVAITPTNILIKKQSTWCTNVDAIPAETLHSFYKEQKKTKRTAYNFDIDGYVSQILPSLPNTLLKVD